MSDLTEKIAARAYVAAGAKRPWAGLHPRAQDAYRRDARVALDVVREELLSDRALQAMEDALGASHAGRSDLEINADAMRAALDAAMNQETNQ